MAIQDFTAGQVLTAAQMDSLQANDYNWTVSTKTDSYTLVAADKGTRVVMNKATATTITVNTSLFSAGDTLFIQNIGAGTCTVTAGTATVTTAGSLALAQWGGGTLYFTSASAAIFFSGGAPAYGTATGGIGAPTAVTIGGVNYEFLQFNSTGTLTITKAGFFDFLAIGGGTGGMACAVNSGRGGGGGGAGQVVFGSVYLDANQTITIGAGGSFFATGTNFSQGGNTSIAATSPFTQTALGGLAETGPEANGQGFVGGGAGSTNATTSKAITGSAAMGFKGGNSTSADNGGGGGSSQGVGSNGAGTTGGAGAAGVDISVFIGGSAAYKASGGGGGGTGAGGAGGSSLGNNGTTNSTPTSAAANTGAGGGGGVGTVYTTGNGGSGICYIRYKV